MSAPDIEPCTDPAGHTWQESQALGGCEICGDHDGLFCVICLETVDLTVYPNADPRRP